MPSVEVGLDNILIVGGLLERGQPKLPAVAQRPSTHFRIRMSVPRVGIGDSLRVTPGGDQEATVLEG